VKSRTQPHLNVVRNADASWKWFCLPNSKNFGGSFRHVEVTDAEFDEIYFENIVRPEERQMKSNAEWVQTKVSQ
jgi:hypothetical protein